MMKLLTSLAALAALTLPQGLTAQNEEVPPPPPPKEKKIPKLEIGKVAHVDLMAAVRKLGLKDIDGKDLSVRALGGKTVVVNFWATRCPVQRGYEKRLAKIVADYEKKGVVFLMVNSNAMNGELSKDAVKGRAPDEPTEKELEKSYPEIRATLRKHELPYRVIVDDESKLANLFGAKTTPDIFVFDAKRTFVYRGAIDDDQRGRKVDETYLTDVLDTLLDPKKTMKAYETPSVGCSIKRPKKAKVGRGKGRGK